MVKIFLVSLDSPVSGLKTPHEAIIKEYRNNPESGIVVHKDLNGFAQGWQTEMLEENMDDYNLFFIDEEIELTKKGEENAELV
jgi:hypothetical protein